MPSSTVPALEEPNMPRTVLPTTVADDLLSPTLKFPAHAFHNLVYLRGALPASRPSGAAATGIALYAFVTIAFILFGAVAGVTAVGLRVREQSISLLQQLTLVLNLVFFVVVEGYLGFHRSWAPVTARRCFLAGFAAKVPSSASSTCAALFAPVFAMGFFFASRRRLIISYVLTFFIVGVVMAVKQSPSPWHEIIDCGVGAGLGAGTLSFCYFFVKCMCDGVLPPDVDARRAKAARGCTSHF